MPTKKTRKPTTRKRKTLPPQNHGLGSPIPETRTEVMPPSTKLNYYQALNADQKQFDRNLKLTVFLATAGLILAIAIGRMAAGVPPNKAIFDTLFLTAPLWAVFILACW